jgi:hypothetical protein
MDKEEQYKAPIGLIEVSVPEGQGGHSGDLGK